MWRGRFCNNVCVPTQTYCCRILNSASVRELFFVVAYTQEHGAEVISERIRRQFQGSEQSSTGKRDVFVLSQLSGAHIARGKRFDGNLRGTRGCWRSRSHQHHILTEECLAMSQKTILIVDDDPDVRLGLHLRLKANHYNVIFAADGMASIAEARKHIPDLIILDLGLPAGDGFSVMERLKANDSLSLIPVIVLSARDRAANMDRALKAGAKAFLQKPVDNAQLLSVIRQVLGEKHHAPVPVFDLGEM